MSAINVILISNDSDKQYAVSKEACSISKLITDMIHDIADADLADNPIPLPKVSSHILELVIEFLTHYQIENMSPIPKPIQSGDMKVNAGEWFGNYVDNLSKEDHFAMINAANFMGIQPLLSLVCCRIAAQIYGKRIDEVAGVFGLPKDIKFTEEDKNRVYETYPWVKAIRDKIQARIAAATTDLIPKDPLEEVQDVSTEATTA